MPASSSDDDQGRKKRNDELLMLKTQGNPVGASSLADAVVPLSRIALVSQQRACGCFVVFLGIFTFFLSIFTFTQCSGWRAWAILLLGFVWAVTCLLLFVCFVFSSNHATKSCFIRGILWSLLSFAVIGLFFLAFHFIRLDADTIVFLEVESHGNVMDVATPCANYITYLMTLVMIVGATAVFSCIVRVVCFRYVYTTSWMYVRKVYPDPADLAA